MAPDGIDFNSPAYNDRFPKISPKEYDQLGIVCLLPTGELDIMMWEAIQDPLLIRELFLEGYLPKMEVTEGTEGVAPDVRELIPRLVEHVPFGKNNPSRAPRTRKRFLCPSEYMKLTAAELLAGIKSSDQSHPVCHPTDPRISCLLLSQPYKNSLNLIKKTAEQFRLQREDPTLPYYSDTHSGRQQLYGFGGSTTAMGAEVLCRTDSSDTCGQIHQSDSITANRVGDGMQHQCRSLQNTAVDGSACS
jgi:hypothetical protein